MFPADSDDRSPCGSDSISPCSLARSPQYIDSSSFSYPAILLNLGVKGAAPLSKATILGESLGNQIFLCCKRHPKADRPIIDYEVSFWQGEGGLRGIFVLRVRAR
jgi:hypothetical protein